MLGLLEKGYVNSNLILKYADKDGLMAKVDYTVLKEELAKLTEEEFLSIVNWDEVVDLSLEMLEEQMESFGGSLIAHPILMCDTDVLVQKLETLAATDSAKFNSYVGGAIYDKWFAGLDAASMALLQTGGYFTASGKLDLIKSMAELELPMLDPHNPTNPSAAAFLNLQQMMIDRVIEPTEVLYIGEDFKNNSLSSLTADQMKRILIVNETSMNIIIKSVGGYAVAKNYVNVPELLADKDLDISALMAAIENNGEALSSYIYFEELLADIALSQVLAVVPVSAIVAQIDNNELLELVQLINVKQYIIPVLTTVADKLLLNIDKVAIDGNVVASENAVDGLLNVNASALVKAVAGLIPGLNEFASVEDGKFFTTTVDVTYTVDGTAPQKTKSITFELVVEGDFDRLQNAAAKLSEILHTYINNAGIDNGVVIFDVTLPSKVTELYAKALELDAIPDELKVKVLDLVNLNGDKVAGFVDALHGKGGGYRLNRKPEEYTVGSILKLTEGSLATVSCTAQGPAACSRQTCCRTLPMWEKLDSMIDDFFEGITLADILSDELK